MRPERANGLRLQLRGGSGTLFPPGKMKIRAISFVFNKVESPSHRSIHAKPLPFLPSWAREGDLWPGTPVCRLHSQIRDSRSVMEIGVPRPVGGGAVGRCAIDGPLKRRTGILGAIHLGHPLGHRTGCIAPFPAPPHISLPTERTGMTGPVACAVPSSRGTVRAAFQTAAGPQRRSF